MATFFNDNPLQGGVPIRAGDVGALDRPVDINTNLALAADGNVTPSSAVEEFWVQNPIQLSRWNKLFPYQLLVVRRTTRNKSPTYRIEPGWQFTFPLPPEAVNISMPFASVVSATQGGVVEENNGSVFRLIAVRGSTGMLPARGSATQQLGFSLVEAIAGGSIAQIQRTASDFKTLASTVSGQPLTNPNIHPIDDFLHDETEAGSSSLVAKSTGYYQALKLRRFFEAYGAMKKTRQGRNLHLAFAIWKQQEVYLVTPTGNLDISYAAGSPFKPVYNLTMKAWKRVNLDAGTFAAVPNLPIRRDPNAMARALTSLRAARRAVQSLSKVAAAVVGDVDRLIFEPLRETVMFLKDLQGAAQSLAELPDAITAKCKDAWVEAMGSDEAQRSTASETNPVVKAQAGAGRSLSNQTRDMPGATRVQAAADPSGGRVRRQQVADAHPAAGPFLNPKAAFDLMEQTEVDGLRLSPAVRQQIVAERNRVRQLRRRDFEVRGQGLRQAADLLAIALGAGDATYEATYGVSAKRIKTTPTKTDWTALYALNQAAMTLDSLAATGDNEPSAREDHIEVMAGLARRSGIAFTTPRSKFAVPVPYGATLEQLARTYLGTPDRWHELAALNGLRAPYIDEVGFDLPLLVNGAGAQVEVAATQNIYNGQVVYISSTKVRRIKRRILASRPVGTNLVLTLSGAADLDVYKLADGAKLSAFLPDTTNSQQLLYIPSTQEPADDNFITKSIPGVNEFDPMVAVGGVDWLLDQNNDLVITPDGDTRWAVGLTAIIQNVRVAMSVRQGTLLHHDDYGIPLEVGVSTADFDATTTLSAVRRMLSKDPSFSRVDAVRVRKDGPVARLDVSVLVKGTDQPVPVSYQIQPDFPSLSATP